MLTTNVDSVSLVRIEVEPLADHTLVLDVPTVYGQNKTGLFLYGIFRSRCFVAAINTLRNCENDIVCVPRYSGSIYSISLK